MMNPPHENAFEHHTDYINLRWQTFEQALWLLLVIIACLWIIAYQNYIKNAEIPSTTIKVKVNLPAPSTYQPPAAKTEIEPTILPPLPEIVDARPAPEQEKDLASSNRKDTENKTVSEDQVSENVKQLTAEITTALSSVSTIKQPANNSEKTTNTGEFPSRPINPMPHLNRKPKAASGMPYDSDISHTDNHGNLSYRAENGCEFVKIDFPGGESWWFVRKCEKPEEITLNYKREGKIYPSFENIASEKN